MTEAKQKAFEEGYESGAKGSSKPNPYPADSESFAAYGRGVSAGRSRRANVDCQCTAQVRMKTVMPRWRQCKRAAMHGSLFCDGHDPAAKAERAASHEEARLANERRQQALFLARIVTKKNQKS